MPTETFYMIRVYAHIDYRGVFILSEQEQLRILRDCGLPEVWHSAVCTHSCTESDKEAWIFEGLAVSPEEVHAVLHTDAVHTIFQRAGFEVLPGNVVVTPRTRTYGQTRN